jgi:hypothetical protein
MNTSELRENFWRKKSCNAHTFLASNPEFPIPTLSNVQLIHPHPKPFSPRRRAFKHFQFPLPWERARVRAVFAVISGKLYIALLFTIFVLFEYKEGRFDMVV